LSEAVRLVDEFSNSEFFSIIKSMVLNVVSILVISHFVGCLWFFLGTQKFTGYDSWVYFYHFEVEAWEYQYLTSVHWSLTQITPGSMHVQPHNVGERSFAILVLVLGMVIFSSIVSSITAATTQLKNINAKYERQRWSIRRFFRERQISVQLTTRVTRYSDTNVKPKMRQVAVTEVELIKHLPKSMYMDVMLELYDQDLEVHPLFLTLSKMSKIVMQKICTNVLEIKNLAEGDVLFHFGESAESMYFVVRGDLLYGHGPEANGKCTKIRRKQWICEAVLWTPWVHAGSSKALSDSEVIALDNQKFQAVLSQHRADMWIVRKYGAAFVDHLNQLTLLEGIPQSPGNSPEHKLKAEAASEIHITDMLVAKPAIETLPEEAQNAFAMAEDGYFGRMPTAQS